MRLVIQRVKEASVTVEGEVTGNIRTGMLVLVGITHEDGDEDVRWLASKLVQMRIFADSEGKMNQSLLDIGGKLLVISQFTLHAQCQKGNRPSFIRAARPEVALALYQSFISHCEQLGAEVESGTFGADMKVHLINDGPVTIILDSLQRDF